MWAPTCKLLQRRTIEAIGDCNRCDWAACSLLSLVVFALATCHVIGIQPRVAARIITGRSCAAAVNNIGDGDFTERLCHAPIDVVYTWVNGSDTVWLAEMLAYRSRWDSDTGRLRTVEEMEELESVAAAAAAADAAAYAAAVLNATQSDALNATNTTTPMTAAASKVEEDTASAMSRYRDNNELRYSIRSLYKYAPWIRHIYLVTNGQVPAWLNTDHPRVSVVTHAEIFPNPEDLPTFSSPAIEAHLHRIPGVSRRFIYFNDDVMLGAPVWPDSFFTEIAGQKFYPAWDVPKCAPGCVDNWISDGYCDSACNNTACFWDGGDCFNNTKLRGGGSTSSSSSKSSTRYDPSQYDRVNVQTTTVDVESSPSTTNILMPVWSQPCAPGCHDGWLGDLVCDMRCHTAACGWDAGDCGDGELPPRYNDTIMVSIGNRSTNVRIEHFWDHLALDLHSKLNQLRAVRLPVLLTPCINVSLSLNESDSDALVDIAIKNGTIPCSNVSTTTFLVTDRIENDMNILDAVNAVIDDAVLLNGEYVTALPVSLATPDGDCVCTGNETACVDTVEHGARIDLFHMLADAGRRMVLASILRTNVYDCVANVSNNSSEENYALDCALASVENTLNSVLVRSNVTLAPPVRIIDAEQRATPSLRLALLAPSLNSFMLLTQGEALQLALSEAIIIDMNQTMITQPRFPCVTDYSQNSTDNYVVRTCDMGALRLWLNVTSDMMGATSGNESNTRNESYRILVFTVPLNAIVRSRANACASKIHNAAAAAANGVESNVTVSLILTNDTQADLVSPTRAPEVAQHAQESSSPSHSSLRLRAASQTDDVTGQHGRRLLLESEKIDFPEHLRISLHAPPLHWAAAARADAEADLASSLDSHTMLLSAAWARLVTLSLSSVPKTLKTKLPLARGRQLADYYAESLVATNRLVTGAFGKRGRKVPAHMPHMIDTRAMEKLQDKWPEAFRATSARRFRTGVDVQYAFAYFHFLLEGGARDGLDVESFFMLELDSDGDGVLNNNELSTLGAIVYRRSVTPFELKSLRECLVGADAPANVTVSRVRDGPGNERVEEVRVARVRLPTWETLVGCPMVVEAISKHGRFGPMAQDMGTAAADDVSFEMVGDEVNKTLAVLDGVRFKRPRFICINDDMKTPGDDVRGVLKDFYESFVGRPSPLELPQGAYNQVLYIGPLRDLLRARKVSQIGMGIGAIVIVIILLFGLLIFIGYLCGWGETGGGKTNEEDTWSARSRRAYEALTSPVPREFATPSRAKSTARRGGRVD